MIDRQTAHDRPRDLPVLEARYALRVAACLAESSSVVPVDVSARLRFAREQALARARELRRTAEFTATSGASLVLGGGWWPRLGAALPMLALAAGLLWIQVQQNDQQASEAADIDAALLADDLPPSAYADAGFAEFLKAPAPPAQ
jgi:serine/threonine protein kinase HipA of HipAB toxin-antitoxin module